MCNMYNRSNLIYLCVERKTARAFTIRLHNSIVLLIRPFVRPFILCFILLDKIVYSSVESGLAFRFGVLLCVFFSLPIPFPLEGTTKQNNKKTQKEITRTKAKSMHSIRSSSKLRLHYNAQCSIPLNDTQTFDVMSCLQDNDIREVLLAYYEWW